MEMRAKIPPEHRECEDSMVDWYGSFSLW